MGRTTLICVGAAALVTVLAGCGDSDDTDDDSGTASTSGDGSSLVVVANDDLKFDRDTYEAGAGDVDVIYRNDGSIAHTLLIDGVEGFKLSIGDEDSGTVSLEPGTYTIYCDVAGHQSAGMEAELEVS